MKHQTILYGLMFVVLAIAFAVFGDNAPGVIVSSENAATMVNEAGTGEAQMLLSKETTGSTDIYLGRIRFSAGASVPEHIHESSTEMLYIMNGSGEMVIAGKTRFIKAGDAIYVPPRTPHSFTNTGTLQVEAVQVYLPAGPEERFRNWKRK